MNNFDFFQKGTAFQFYVDGTIYARVYLLQQGGASLDLSVYLQIKNNGYKARPGFEAVMAKHNGRKKIRVHNPENLSDQEFLADIEARLVKMYQMEPKGFTLQLPKAVAVVQEPSDDEVPW